MSCVLEVTLAAETVCLRLLPRGCLRAGANDVETDLVVLAVGCATLPPTMAGPSKQCAVSEGVLLDQSHDSSAPAILLRPQAGSEEPGLTGSLQVSLPYTLV